jgi:hypothetical protein
VGELLGPGELRPDGTAVMTEGVYMYSISHWGMFPVFYTGFLPQCSGG